MKLKAYVWNKATAKQLNAVSATKAATEENVCSEDTKSSLL